MINREKFGHFCSGSKIDASLIASFADAVVMVAGYQKTFAEDIKLAAGSLSVSGAKPIYGVINLLNPENSHRAAA